MKYELIPSVIAKNQTEYAKRFSKIDSLAKTIQLDVMDGLFVPSSSLQFPLQLKKKRYEAHLMLEHPDSWVLEHASNVDTVIVHYESSAHLHEIIKLLRKKKVSVGIALKPDTDAEAIMQYRKLIDLILVMTVQPGAYGGKFLNSELNKIAFLRKKLPKIDIEADGGITPATLKLCKAAGANRFVVGSYLQKAKSVKIAWKQLQQAL